MVQDCCQKILIELKCIGKLLGHLQQNIQNGYRKYLEKYSPHLPHAVNPLDKYWTPVWVIVLVLSVSNSLSKFVSKTQPFLLYQNLNTPSNKLILPHQMNTYNETIESAIVIIQKHHRQRCELACSIPTIAAVYQHTSPMVAHLQG